MALGALATATSLAMEVTWPEFRAGSQTPHHARGKGLGSWQRATPSTPRVFLVGLVEGWHRLSSQEGAETLRVGLVEGWALRGAAALRALFAAL